MLAPKAGQIFAVVLLIVFQKNGKDVKRRIFEPGN